MSPQIKVGLQFASLLHLQKKTCDLGAAACLALHINAFEYQYSIQVVICTITLYLWTIASCINISHVIFSIFLIKIRKLYVPGNIKFVIKSVAGFLFVFDFDFNLSFFFVGFVIFYVYFVF